MEVNLYLKMMLNYKFSGFKILVSETDKYHMHFMISYGPAMFAKNPNINGINATKNSHTTNGLLLI